MKTLFPLALLVAACTLPGCGEDDPKPTPASTSLDLVFDLAIKGYSANPAGVGSFGVAATEQDAHDSKPSEGSGTISWTESNGGKNSRQVVLYQRKKGEKLWVFVKANRKAQGTQSVTLTWPVGHSAAITAATDSIVVTSFTVGQ